MRIPKMTFGQRGVDLLKAEFAEQPGRLDFVFSLCGLNS